MKQMPGMGTMPGMSMDSSHAAMGHAPGAMGAADQHMHGMSGMPMSGNDSAMAALHRRMMSDSVIHARIMADTAMRRLMEQVGGAGMAGHAMPGMPHGAMPGMSHGAMPGMSHGAMTKRAPAAARSTTKPRPAVRKPSAKTRAKSTAPSTVKKPAAKPAAKPASKPATRPAPKPKPDDMKNMPGMHR